MGTLARNGLRPRRDLFCQRQNLFLTNGLKLFYVETFDSAILFSLYHSFNYDKRSLRIYTSEGVVVLFTNDSNPHFSDIF